MQECYANVIVDITARQLDRAFQYKIPGQLQGRLEPGMIVEIPFGQGDRIIRGYIVEVTAHADYAPDKMKEIQGIVTEGIGAQSRLIGLAAWIRDRYGSTMLQAMKTVLPVKRKIKRKEKKTVFLTVNQEDAEQKLQFFRQKHQTARARLMEAMVEEPAIPYELVTEKLNVTSSVVKALQQQGLVELRSERVYRNPVDVSRKEEKTVILNKEQQNVVDTVTGEWDHKEASRYLIHGVTGSGKTEVYMELIAYAVSRGQQAIFLIPEIALTYQTVIRFYRRFGDRVSVINSRLSEGEKYDQFERARSGELDVMIGPRSALFTPFPNLGIIVIDEEHEPAYQSEITPRYHAREVAFCRGRMEHAKVVLGSATPSMEAYYAAQNGEIKLFTLTQRANNAQLPEVHITDLRQELKAGNRSILSRELKDKMEQRLQLGQQIMLFLNRRGYAGFVSCRSCGYVIKCPHCDVSLSLHNQGKMICHYCGYEQPAVNLCPECGQGFMRKFKAGTQQVEEEVKKIFPGARTLRMDMDTTREKEGHAAILSAFSNHEADILIGTQMIVKGHDFPDVTLVGILAADLSLHIPDYRSAERTFQLLTQAAGRAGRGKLPGEVVIQTYDPEHYSILTAADQDYLRFYREEIRYRILAGYPPAGGLLAVHCSSEDLKQLELACDYLKKFIVRLCGQNVAVLGPADEMVAKIQDVYRKVIYVKHGEIHVLTSLKNRVERYIAANEGFQTVHIQFEIN